MARFRLVRYLDPAFCEQVPNIPEAERKPAGEPDGLPNNRWREVMVFVTDRARPRGLQAARATCKPIFVTMPNQPIRGTGDPNAAKQRRVEQMIRTPGSLSLPGTPD